MKMRNERTTQEERDYRMLPEDGPLTVDALIRVLENLKAVMGQGRVEAAEVMVGFWGPKSTLGDNGGADSVKAVFTQIDRDGERVSSPRVYILGHKESQRS